MREPSMLLKTAKMYEAYAKALRYYAAGLQKEGNQAWAKAKMYEHYVTKQPIQAPAILVRN